jgi:hypothetical protein
MKFLAHGIKFFVFFGEKFLVLSLLFEFFTLAFFLRPIRYHYSASDWIVPAALNVPPLVTAMATAGASSLLTGVFEDSPNHDQIPQELEMHTITEWLRSLL